MPTTEDYARSKYRKLHNLAWCSSCKVDKPQSDFSKCPGRRPFGLSSHCLECDNKRKSNQKSKKYWSLTIEERRVFNRSGNIGRFGITLDEYNQMLEAQNSVCAICQKPESVKHPSTNEIQPLVVDHNHDTGSIRGLLCSKCNLGIGLFFDNEETLLLAAQYIIKSKES